METAEVAYTAAGLELVGTIAFPESGRRIESSGGWPSPKTSWSSAAVTIELHRLTDRSPRHVLATIGVEDGLQVALARRLHGDGVYSMYAAYTTIS